MSEMGAVFMMEFAWPYVFLLIPLPWVVYRFLPASQWNEKAALKVPELNDFNDFHHPSSKAFPKVSFCLAFLVWVALLTAAARPQWIGEAKEIPQSGRDLMLAVDLSASMQIKDFEINGQFTDRLTALKFIAGDFIERRKGDRIGLILFGTQAYLQTPLTFDTKTVKQLLNESEIGLAGNETAIGDAIGLAVKHLQNRPHASRVLILLTDGNNNAGKLTPEKAAEIASHTKLKVHTIAIGSKEPLMQTAFGLRAVPASKIDEAALQMVAEKTGGKYFRAYNSQELVQIYHEIDQIETTEQAPQQYRLIDEMYVWPLGVSLLGIMVLLLASMSKCFFVRQTKCSVRL